MMATVPTPTMPNAQVWDGGGLRDLYRDHRWSLVRLASLLTPEPGDAEDVVQEAFVKAHQAWARLRDPDKAMAYLRSAVLNGARSRLRHRRVVERFEPAVPRPGRSPEAAAVAGDERGRIMAALRSLPQRQRECLVLRYYLDLTEAEISAAMGISAGSVKTHAHRGLAALAAQLEELQ